ncbi:hypothetical protein D9M68_671860 [compost metagenome]
MLHQVGQHALVLGQVLRHLCLYPHGGVQSLETLLPALTRFLRHSFTGDAVRVVGWIQVGKLLIQALHFVGESLGLRQQARRGGEVPAQPIDHVVVQGRQVAALVQQHLGLVLQLTDLVVDHLQRAHCGQGVLREVGRVDHGERAGRLEGQQAQHQQGRV